LFVGVFASYYGSIFLGVKELNTKELETQCSRKHFVSIYYVFGTVHMNLEVKYNGLPIFSIYLKLFICFQNGEL
jgi:hypothetical protein